MAKKSSSLGILTISYFLASILHFLNAPHHSQLEIPQVAGRLGQTIEQGTKRGLFAIGNYVNQRLLKPVHDLLMASYCATDGTFNQERPLDRLIGSSCCHCFDLK